MKKYPIGFNSFLKNERTDEAPVIENAVSAEARKSVVEVYFPSKNMHFTYYNDMFDLKKGDLVYVDGKLEGHMGYVMDVSYSFKIKIADYEKVISVADTKVKGDLFSAGSHMISFGENVIPAYKVRSWFIPPQNEDEYATGNDESSSFSLDDLSGMNVKKEVAERGHDYYINDRIPYICIDGSRGFAIVSGSENYEVEFNFDYDARKISNIKCSCFCGGACKHEVAAMLLLGELLELICEKYENEFTGYFAAIGKDVFANLVLKKDNIKISIS